MEAHRYYVVYEVWKEGRIVGKGYCASAFKKKMSEMKDIEDMCKIIKDNNKVEDGQVVIVNWILMGEFKYGD